MQQLGHGDGVLVIVQLHHPVGLLALGENVHFGPREIGGGGRGRARAATRTFRRLALFLTIILLAEPVRKTVRDKLVEMVTRNVPGQPKNFQKHH